MRWKLAGTAAGNWSVTFRIHTMANKGSAGGVPASLALGGWWRGSYAGTPWVGVASAGSSEGRTLVDGITPGTGAALNGFDTAQFNGTSQYFASTIDAGALFTSAAGSIAVLYYAQTAPAPGPNPYDDPALLGLYFWGTLSLAVNSTGVRAGIFGVDSVLYEATATTSTGAWHLAQMRWNTVNLEVRVDGGAWQTSSSGGGANGEIFGASAAQVGTDYVRAVFFDGLIVEILAAPVTLDDATFDNIKGYCNARYALSL